LNESAGSIAACTGRFLDLFSGSRRLLFAGEQYGQFGYEEYSRGLSPEEEAVMDAPWHAEVAKRAAAQTIARDAWFGFSPTSMDDRDRGGDRDRLEQKLDERSTT
jgi:hypothetical protein